MRSFLLISVFLVGAAGTSLSAENDVPKDHLKGFGDWIRYYGYNCGKSEVRPVSRCRSELVLENRTGC